jgi:diadenosine tetraphosphate (Ap4A) HIT family hydrolase
MSFVPPPETVIHRTSHWLVNHRVDSRLPGYLIIGATDPAADELWKVSAHGLAELGGLQAKCVRALQETLRARRVYLGRFGHTPGHAVHFHVIPIYEWVEEAYARHPRYGDPAPDGAALTVFVMREFCESPTPPEIRGPSVADVVATLRAALA